MDDLNTVEEGKRVHIKKIEKQVLKELAPGTTWVKTKEVLKTTGKVALVFALFTGFALAIGAASAYAEDQMK